MNETLTPIEAGLYLNVHVRTIYRLAKNGLIPGRKLGGRWRFKKAILDEWLSGRKIINNGRQENSERNIRNAQASF
jgi:excisionase family DNA binding protein